MGTVHIPRFEVIEGKLRFVLKPKKYHNNEVYDVAVLESAED